MNDESNTAERPDAYAIKGSLSGAEVRTGQKGEYVYGKLTYRSRKTGQTRTDTVMGFGKGCEAVKALWNNGSDITLFGAFDGGVFKIYGLGKERPRQQDAAKAA